MSFYKKSAQISLLSLIIVFAVFIILCDKVSASGPVYNTYFSNGTSTSNNLLPSSGVSAINSFDYSISSLPSGTGMTVQFSQDNTSWYNSSNVLNSSNTLSSGTHNIGLTGLNWTGPYFYYRVMFTSTGTSTPVLDSVGINFTSNNYYWVGSSGGSWNSSANWSASSGGTGGIGVPGSADTAIFDTGGNTSSSIDVNVNVAGISIVSGYTGTITQTSTYTVTIGASGYVQNGGTFVGGSGTITDSSEFTITSGTFTAGSGILSVAGNFSNSGTFTSGTGTTTFNGVNQSLTGSTTFYNFVKSVTSTSTLTFASNSTTTIASGGTLTLTGAAGNLLSLRSSATPTKWNLNVDNSATVLANYLDVMDSDASSGKAIVSTNSTSSGNNLNWVFNTAPNIPTLISPTSASYTSNNKPTLSANYSDPDTGDTGTTNYRIATSSANCLAGTGIIASGTSAETSTNNATTTWTPGSSIGSDTTYYWCAQNNDGVQTSSWTSMGNFILDTMNPTSAITSPTDNSFSSSTTVALAGTSSDTNLSTTTISVDGGEYVATGGVASSWTYSSTSLSQGAHTFQSKAMDFALNTGTSTTVHVTVDTTTPAGGSVTYTNGYFATTSIPITYVLGTDGVSGLNNSSGKIQRATATLSAGSCGLYGAFSDLVTEYDGSYTDISVSDGNCYKYQYLISDNATNTATYTSVNVAKVDTVAPSVNAGTDKTKNAIFTQDATSTDTGSGIASYLWSQVSGPGTITFGSDTSATTTVSASTDGAYVIKLTVVDNATNSASSTFNLNWDTIVPTTTDDYTSKDGNWQADSQTISLIPSDPSPSSGIKWIKYCTGIVDTCDPSIGTTLDSPYEIVISATGTTYFRYASQDNASNTQSTVSRTVMIDAVAPTVTDNVPSGWQNSNITVTLSCDDGAGSGCSKVYYTTDGTTPATSTSAYVDSSDSWQFIQSTAGDLTLKYRGLDAVGNFANTVTATNHLQLDKTVPTVSMTAPTNTATVSGATVTVSATSSDDVSVSGVQFKLDTNTDIGAEDIVSPYSVTWDSAQVSDGAHTIIAVSRDQAGNYATSTVVNITVDNTAPVRSNGAPSGTLAINTSSTTISLNTGESATCKYSTSSSTAYGSMTPFTATGGTSHSSIISGLSNGGSYIYYVKCSDGQNNINNTEFTISFTVQADVTGPNVSVTAPSNNAYASGTLSITADATDDVMVSGVQFKLDTNTDIEAEDIVAPYAVNLDTTALADGPHTIIAVARDNSGHYATSSTITITVDNTLPVVNAGTDKIKNGLFTQNATGTDATAGVDSYLWSKVSGPGTINFGTGTAESTTVSANADGNYVLRLLVRDNAGNSASSTFNLLWDVTNPSVNAGTDKTKNAIFTQDATSTDTGSGIASYLWSQVSGPGTITFGSDTSATTTVSASTDGAYVIKLTVVDNATNSASSTFNLLWDTTAPTVIDNVPSGWQNANITVTLSCDDGSGSGCSKVYYTTDGTTPATSSSQFVDSASSWQFTQMVFGDYVFKYRGEDSLGNLESTQTAVNHIQLDKGAPTVIDNVLSGWHTSDITVTLSCTDNGSDCLKVYYTTDGSTPATSTSAFVDATGSWKFVFSTEEIATLKYSGLDNVGNFGVTTVAVNSLMLDKTTPVISNVLPVNGSNISRAGDTVTFTISDFSGLDDCRLSTSLKSYNTMVSDGNASCTITNGIQVSCAIPAMTTGNKDVYLACKDSAGNTDTSGSATHMAYVVPASHSGGSSSGGGSTPAPIASSTYSVFINSGEQATAQRVVNLQFSAEPSGSASAMIISTNPDFSNTLTIPYQTASYPYDLCRGAQTCPDASYTIYTKFISPSGIATSAISSSINLNTVPLITEVIDKAKTATEQVTNVITQVVTNIIPSNNESVVYPPPEQSVPKTAQETFQNKWPIAIPSSLNNFVFENLPSTFQNFINKFPEIGTTLQKIGITRMSDVSQLSDVGSISLPGLAEIAGLSNGQGLALADFSSKQNKQIPTDVIFVRNASETVDLQTKLSVSNTGLALQTLNTIQGQPLKFIVKTEGKAERVQGYMIFKSSNSNSVSVKKSGATSAFLQTASVAYAMENNPSIQGTTVSTDSSDSPDLVLNKFDYKDSGNGIWTAEVTSPLALGQYELRTIINYEGNTSPKTISMVVVVDPEGYVYRMNNGEETRINNALVSIYWLNPKTNAYEIWPASDFRQTNPQTTDVTGRYAFLVPIGTYKLKVTADSYLDYEGGSFKVDESKGVFINIELKEKLNLLKVFNFQTILLLGIFIALIYLIIIFTIRRGKKDKLLYN